MASRAVIDPTVLRELVLYAVNDSTLYHKTALPILVSLAKKIRKGSFDPTKAPKAFEYLADAAAKKYTKEFGSGNAVIFNAATRKQAALELFLSYQELLEDMARDSDADTTYGADLRVAHGERKSSRSVNPVTKKKSRALLSFGRDVNGNKLVRLSTDDGSFTIQTLGNIPSASWMHKDDLKKNENIQRVLNEVSAHVREFGTARQRKIMESVPGNLRPGSYDKNPTAPKSIAVRGVRWFQKTYGNTYNAFSVEVDGTEVYRSPMEYGYGEGYLQRAGEWLMDNGYLPKVMGAGGGYKNPRLVAEENGIAFDYYAKDVKTERELKNFAAEPTKAKKSRRKNPSEVHIDINSHNTRGAGKASVRAKNPRPAQIVDVHNNESGIAVEVEHDSRASYEKTVIPAANRYVRKALGAHGLALVGFTSLGETKVGVARTLVRYERDGVTLSGKTGKAVSRRKNPVELTRDVSLVRDGKIHKIPKGARGAEKAIMGGKGYDVDFGAAHGSVMVTAGQVRKVNPRDTGSRDRHDPWQGRDTDNGPYLKKRRPSGRGIPKASKRADVYPPLPPLKDWNTFAGGSYDIIAASEATEERPSAFVRYSIEAVPSKRNADKIVGYFARVWDAKAGGHRDLTRVVTKRDALAAARADWETRKLTWPINTISAALTRK